MEGINISIYKKHDLVFVLCTIIFIIIYLFYYLYLHNLEIFIIIYFNLIYIQFLFNSIFFLSFIFILLNYSMILQDIQPIQKQKVFKPYI